MINGWNAGNGDAFAAPYTKGYEQVSSFHKMLFDKFVKGSRLIGKLNYAICDRRCCC
jgi:hypothetical protein